MYDDPIVDEVRKIRETLAKKHDFDLGLIFEDLRKRQSKVRKRVVKRRSDPITKIAAPNGDFTPLHPGR